MTSPDVGVIGTGLIGTSIAAAAVAAGSSVQGYDLDAEALAMATRRAGIEPGRDVREVAMQSDLVFVCVPVERVAQVASEFLAFGEGIVTDVASVKGSVLSELDARTQGVTPSRFVGGHPMFGSERSGPASASPALLDGATWVLTPTDGTDDASVAALEAWVASVGARPLRMEPEAHDRAVALVSHLPQLASTALMNLVARRDAAGQQLLRLAAGGFRDLTRLAASDPHLWAGIAEANRQEAGAALDLFIEELRGVRRMLSDGDAVGLEQALAAAKRSRLELAAKPKVRSGVAILQVPVSDRPGVLADLTRVLGERAVNIEDMEIVHSPEGGRGSAYVTVAADEADLAFAALAGAGFQPNRIA